MTIDRVFRLQLRNSATFARMAILGVLLSSCSEATRPLEESVSVCHVSGLAGTLLDVGASEVVEHSAHGDYVARLFVSHQPGPDGDGIHFPRITDAIASARAGRIQRGETSAAKCRITIVVAPGVYVGSVSSTVDAGHEKLPLMIDVPDITLLGAFVMPVDARGRATGTGAAGGGAAISTLLASPGLVSIKTGNALDKYAESMIVVNGHPEGPWGDGAVIEGFVFRSGNTGDSSVVGGNAVWAIRAKGLLVKGNQIEEGFSEPLEMRASVGRIERNVLTGRGGSCAMCLFGPGDYEVIDNRQVGPSGRLAVLIFPAMFAAVPPNVEQMTPPSTAVVSALVKNNVLRDHQEVPFGIGLRVAAVGPGAPDVVGTAKVVAEDNDLSSNRFAVVVEAGFLVANKVQSGSIDLTLKGNTLTGSCQVGLLVAFQGQSTAVGTQQGLSTRNSTYNLTLGNDIGWSDAWYSHPAGSGNTLMVDGQQIASGSRSAYDARGC